MVVIVLVWKMSIYQFVPLTDSFRSTLLTVGSILSYACFITAFTRLSKLQIIIHILLSSV